MRVILAIFIAIGTIISVNAQTVDEIVSKHIEAIGGKAAWKKINSLKIDAVLNVNGTDVVMSMVQLQGKGVRHDISVQGMNGYRIVTPRTGWVFLPFQGQTTVDSMTSEDVRFSQGELDIQGPLLDYKEKGHTAELAGKENIGGVDTYKIIVTFNSGKKETAFIDSKNYYIVRAITKQKMNDQEQDIESNFTGFEKLTEGIVLARKIALPYGNLSLNKIEINVPVDENIFKLPK